jgi:hypothetical protein
VTGLTFAVLLAFSVIAVVVSLADAGTSPEASPPHTTLPRKCDIGPELVPSCGAYWGAYSTLGWQRFENLAGRKLAIVHEYSAWSTIFPTLQFKAAAESGSLLLVDWSLRGARVTWRSIAEGKDDGQIHREAEAIKAFGRPLMIAFSAEPEQPRFSVYGTAADYVAAWHRVHDVFRAADTRNVVWVWDVTGDVANFGREYPSLYPGNGYVNWIMWDPFNWYGCKPAAPSWQSFSEVVSPMYSWLVRHSDKPGNGDYLSKAWGIAEYGTVAGPLPSSKGTWFESEISQLERGLPRLKAVVYFDANDYASGRDCHWVIDNSTESVQGFRKAGQQEYVSYMPFADDSDQLAHSRLPTTTTSTSSSIG